MIACFGPFASARFLRARGLRSRKGGSSAPCRLINYCSLDNILFRMTAVGELRTTAAHLEAASRPLWPVPANAAVLESGCHACRGAFSNNYGKAAVVRQCYRGLFCRQYLASDYEMCAKNEVTCDWSTDRKGSPL